MKMKETGLLDRLAAAEAVPEHRPWPRYLVDAPAWEATAADLAGPLDLMALWADVEQVHMAIHEPASGFRAILSLALADGGYPSVARHHAPAMRLERAIRDLYGHAPQGLPDERPWLDHGTWPERHPMNERHPMKPGKAPSPAPRAYQFLPAEGEGLHQIPVGPVHAGIIEPGHFRFTASGETVVRLEERLGYVHKGIEKLLQGKDLAGAAALCGRVSGDSTVAYAIAFARAAEAALDCAPPARADWLRALMAELERLANHLGDIGAICNDAAFALMHAHCGILREEVLQAANACFGHRLMMDRVLPGGVAVDLADAGVATLRALVSTIETRFATLVEVYDNTTSLKDRTRNSGILDGDLARRFAAGGFVGRASGRAFDARVAFPYPPYDRLTFSVPTLEAGDVDARIWIRIREVEQSLSLITQILDALPGGEIFTPPPARARRIVEGIGVVEGFRGEILVWLRLAADGTVLRCHPRDPSWFQWPLLEAVIENNIVADFPLCNKSFNCSYAGVDL